MAVVPLGVIISLRGTCEGNTGGSPFYMKVMIDDKVIKIKEEEFFANLIPLGRRPGGAQANPVVACSCKIITGILFNTRELGHAPGPNGLSGGYSIKISAQGVEVFIPEGLTLEEAIRINNDGQKFDGVESIQNDGTVVITEKTAAIFKKLLDFDCRTYKVNETEARSKELDERFKRWVAAQVK